MNNNPRELAMRYACAFLNLFEDELTPGDMAALCKAASVFSRNNTRLALLLAPYMETSYVVETLTKACVDMGVPRVCERIIQLLVASHRIALLAEVLVQICEQYKVRHAILTCCIISSHELTPDEKENVKLFIERATGCVLMEQYTIDHSLIAGVRVVANTIFWEYSVRRYLSEVGRQLTTS